MGSWGAVEVVAPPKLAPSALSCPAPFLVPNPAAIPMTKRSNNTTPPPTTTFIFLLHPAMPFFPRSVWSVKSENPPPPASDSSLSPSCGMMTASQSIGSSMTMACSDRNDWRQTGAGVGMGPVLGDSERGDMLDGAVDSLSGRRKVEMEGIELSVE